MKSYKLGERAVLMRLSISLPGENRKDSNLSDQVKSEHSLGRESGKWIKALYPAEAMEPIKKLDNEARAYHGKVTLPWDAGVGILPAGLISEYGDRMREFKGQREHQVESHFLARLDDWISWARTNHNGTFDASLYPPADELREKFGFRTEPLPVPGSEHFSETLASLLGTDTESVNCRVVEASKEAGQELMRRIIAPVRAMAEKLSEQPKPGKQDICFRDSLVGNLMDIVELAPKLNLSGDSQIDAFVLEIGAKLAGLNPKLLREDVAVRSQAAQAATDLMKRLEGYTF